MQQRTPVCQGVLQVRQSHAERNPRPGCRPKRRHQARANRRHQGGPRRCSKHVSYQGSGGAAHDALHARRTGGKAGAHGEVEPGCRRHRGKLRPARRGGGLHGGRGGQVQTPRQIGPGDAVRLRASSPDIHRLTGVPEAHKRQQG